MNCLHNENKIATNFGKRDHSFFSRLITFQHVQACLFILFIHSSYLPGHPDSAMVSLASRTIFTSGLFLAPRNAWRLPVRPCPSLPVAYQGRRSMSSARSKDLRYTETHLDTIFALSTHPGKAGIAIVRVSGPQARTVLRTMTPASSPIPKARLAVTRRLQCPQTSDLLDKGMVLWFPGK